MRKKETTKRKEEDIEGKMRVNKRVTRQKNLISCDTRDTCDTQMIFRSDSIEYK